MAKLSDIIEGFIKEMIEDAEDNMIEIQRNLLAHQFDCAPSQINYVLTTRFNNDRGYIIESRRGGGGYVKIYKIPISKNNHIENILNKSIGESITKSKAYDLLDTFYENGMINEREQNIIKRALSDRALAKIYYDDRNKLRADIFKEILLVLLNE